LKRKSHYTNQAMNRGGGKCYSGKIGELLGNDGCDNTGHHDEKVGKEEKDGFQKSKKEERRPSVEGRHRRFSNRWIDG